MYEVSKGNTCDRVSSYNTESLLIGLPWVMCSCVIVTCNDKLEIRSTFASQNKKNCSASFISQEIPQKLVTHFLHSN
jgi:hypothetical protein